MGCEGGIRLHGFAGPAIGRHAHEGDLAQGVPQNLLTAVMLFAQKTRQVGSRWNFVTWLDHGHGVLKTHSLGGGKRPKIESTSLHKARSYKVRLHSCKSILLRLKKMTEEVPGSTLLTRPSRPCASDLSGR